MLISKRMRIFVLIAAITAIGAGSAGAEVPDKFTNLKVFPETIGKQELIGAMRSFSMGLGVRCDYCHVMKTPGDFDSMDWASDKMEHKKTARIMVRMVRQINGKLLPEPGEEPMRVTCVTCHRGLTNPATLEQVLMKTYEKKSLESMIARYRELREKYYGSGSYDFGPMSLAHVAEALARGKGNLEGALTVLQLNVEMNPKHAESYLMMAQAKMMKQDSAGALASVKKALEIDPENRQAKQMLKMVKPNE